MAVLGNTLKRVMVVVPSLAERNQSDPPEVSAIVSRLVVLITPHVRRRVDTPSNVQHIHQSHEHPPNDERYSRIQVPATPTDTEDDHAQKQMPPQKRSVQQPHERLFHQVRSISAIELCPVL